MRQSSSFNPHWSIVVSFIAILIIEAIVPDEYVISYGFIVPILLAADHIDYPRNQWVSVLAVIATLVSGLSEQPQQVFQLHPEIFVNRVIVSLLLLAVTWMSQRQASSIESIDYQAIAHHQFALMESRSKFIDAMSRDFITAFLGAIETISTFRQGDFGVVTPAQEHALAVMSRSHRLGVHQIEIMLDIKSDDEYGLCLNYQRTDLAIVAKSAIDHVTDLATSRQIEIQFVNENDTTELVCDPARIDRVLTSLLLNAVSQSPLGSQVIFRTIDLPTDYLVQVADFGRAIKPEDLPDIFSKLHYNRISRHAKGAGSGLYLSQKIIEAHGGKIWVEPISSVGVTFSFTIPKALDR